MEGKRLEGDRTLYVDCDDTLVAWNISEYPDLPRLQVTCFGYTSELVPNQKNINLVVKFAKLGYKVVVWSQSGSEWAETIGRAVCIDDYVSLYISKPSWYLDDLPATDWLNRRIWRAPEP
jgi:hypothetical protein